ncbi:MAG: bifunctional 5,10-methylenetetrahydrofolate dehydrogenase/5,10-methenyltetrahydrofolate cyclohydrolase [Patescibacteria group bacterium]
MQIIDGKKIKEEIIARLKNQPRPGKRLAAILFGNDRLSEIFIKEKEKAAKELGVDFKIYQFDEKLSNDQARDEISKIALQKPVGGVIVQLPLPEYLNGRYVLNVIPREKDVDVLGERALGAFYANRNLVLPPPAGAVEEILNSKSYILNSKNVAVVGLGFLIGRPIGLWLIGKAQEIYLLASQSDLGILKHADLVISGVGKAGLIKPDMLKNGAGIIDFGYEEVNGKAKGDFDANTPGVDKMSFYTSTPGGTGPIVVAKIFENFYKLNT